MASSAGSVGRAKSSRNEDTEMGSVHSLGGAKNIRSHDTELGSVHSVDKAALVWQHMRENSGLTDDADSLYDETGLMGPPWL